LPASTQRHNEKSILLAQCSPTCVPSVSCTMIPTHLPLLRLPAELLTHIVEDAFNDHIYTIRPPGGLIPHALLRTCQALRSFHKLFLYRAPGQANFVALVQNFDLASACETVIELATNTQRSSAAPPLTLVVKFHLDRRWRPSAKHHNICQA